MAIVYFFNIIFILLISSIDFTIQWVIFVQTDNDMSIVMTVSNKAWYVTKNTIYQLFTINHLHMSNM